MILDNQAENTRQQIGILNREVKDTFQCTECPKAYSRKRSLWEHKSRDHGQEWRCITCGKSFKRRNNLKRHMKNHNTSGSDKKKLIQISRRMQRQRMKNIINKFNEDIKDFLEEDRKKMFCPKSMETNCSEVISIG